MSNESLGTTRRTLLTALGAVAVYAFAPLTAFACRRQRGCCSPGRSYAASGISISSPPCDLIIDSPSGPPAKIIAVSGSIQAFPGGTAWRVILTISPTAYDTSNAPTTDALPAYWTIVTVPQTGGAFSANVTCADGLPQGATLSTLGNFQLSVIGQLYFNSAWYSIYNIPVPLHGHTPTPTP